MVSFEHDRIRVCIVEAKNRGSRVRNEAEATKQLLDTQKMLCRKRKLNWRRKVIPRMGAYLEFFLRADI